MKTVALTLAALMIAGSAAAMTAGDSTNKGTKKVGLGYAYSSPTGVGPYNDSR